MPMGQGHCAITSISCTRSTRNCHRCYWRGGQSGTHIASTIGIASSSVVTSHVNVHVPFGSGMTLEGPVIRFLVWVDIF